MAAEPFWTRLAEGGDAPALSGPSGALTYAGLAAAAETAAARFAATERGLVLLAARLDLEGAVLYLGALLAGQPVFLIKPEIEADDLARLIELYRPLFVARPEAGGYRVERREASAYPIHPDLALLLSTSGSVGAPKAVRIAYSALAANADQIALALGLEAHERAALTMPLYFTYGLSVLNSQLRARASVWLDPRSAIDPGLWRDLEANGVTSFHGVPMTYQLLQRLKKPEALERMTRLTQAGGRLPEAATEWLAEISRRSGVKVWKMYGMTEATARIAVLPADRLFDRPDAAGLAVPGGRLEIGPDGQVVYRGPNVMMGYAEGWADLARGDDLGGVLVTTDAGRLDDEGFLYVSGRMDRTVKLFGLRIDLDHVERTLGAGEVAAVFDGERIRVFAADGKDRKDAALALARKIQVPPNAIALETLDALPRTGSNKIDYRALKAMAGGA